MLAHELGAPVPEGVAALPRAGQEALALALRRARRRQAAALDEAIEEAMDHVPRLLRGAVRRVVG